MILASSWSLAFGQSNSTEDNHKKRLHELAKVQLASIERDALNIWELAEVGFQEYKSSGILQGRLADAGFEIERGLAGMTTSFVAKYRNGDGPVIGLLAEYDALLGLTQYSISERKPLDDRQAGHGCGHNLLGTGSTGAAIILKQWMEGNDVKGEIRLYGCPADSTNIIDLQ